MEQWDAKTWLKRFESEGADKRALRREVWENTVHIVEKGGYNRADGTFVRIGRGYEMIKHSRMYHAPTEPSRKRPGFETQITVTASDCLDVAREWVRAGMEVSLLNMANRQNPGGGVINGAGAQEEYLFRCSNYYRGMFRYAPYAGKYGLTRSHWSYPLDRDYGGIYTPGVTVFRENECRGYALSDEPWRVNMIAVAGMNNPRLVYENGEACIAPELVDGVKNKIRTIFNIAIDQGQTNLVLGALGCGAFHNPPKHVAQLFAEVLCEREFHDAFQRICFAVKQDHNSRGDSNYAAFKAILDGFQPTEAKLRDRSRIPIRKVKVYFQGVIVLREDGSADKVDKNLQKWDFELPDFKGICDIAVGPAHILGLRNRVVFVDKIGERTDCWLGAKAISACEGHYGVVTEQGRVFCMDDEKALETFSEYYADTVRRWRDIQQIALTYYEPYALTNQGRLLGRHRNTMEFFNDPQKPEIKQIAAFQCYYSLPTIAALYSDGTVKATWDGEEIKEVSDWQAVCKIACGNHGGVAGLTESGVLLIPDFCEFRDKAGQSYTRLEDVKDFDMDYDTLVCLKNNGEILVLDR